MRELKHIFYLGRYGWGNSSYYLDKENTKIYGWKPNRFYEYETCVIDLCNHVNDEFTPILLLTNVEWQHDPNDMFFADYIQIGEIPTYMAKIGGELVGNEVKKVFDNYYCLNNSKNKIQIFLSKLKNLFKRNETN